nr:secretion ATPase [Raoultella sp. NCTC 9187]
MDEATSHLDINNEKMVNAAIESLNITRIIIAHRPSTIASADRIIDLAKLTSLPQQLTTETILMNILTGINSGIIKSPNAVLALALKMQSVVSAEALVYLPPDRVQDLVFAVFSGYRRLQMLFREDPESIRARTIADTERLNNRTLTVTLDEIQNPNVALRVTDFVMKDGQEKVTFLFFLQNDEVISVDLTVTQMEFLLNLLLATIHKTGTRRLFPWPCRQTILFRCIPSILPISTAAELTTINLTCRRGNSPPSAIFIRWL